MFQNRKLLNKIMYGLALVMIASLVILAIGPGILN